MATFNVAHEPLYRLAYAVAPLFSHAASYASPDDAPSGESRLFINNPFGPETRAVALAFPAHVLERYDEMDVRSQACVHCNVAKITYAWRGGLLDNGDDVASTIADPTPYEILFGDEILGALH
jgi:hypothetical protein